MANVKGEMVCNSLKKSSRFSRGARSSVHGLQGVQSKAARTRDTMNMTNNKQKQKTYNSRDSHVVTHHTTNLPACGLSTAERTGSPVLHTLWSYVSANKEVRTKWAIISNVKSI
ncbi:uncharacterized protein N7469_000570 [Penicillium citrinum]|uniref:Uncharacterized protein n=2 Tax=Penicillium TaxID=5073 RepID=A0A9W9TV07_PENCI|nr:uncharacterized protein N7469_000570 [Penicillium citrinum]KAJ5242243.1 hypothetical protein N7469_000570 [Penicillium citrinum]KAJ5600268.1 hypothetical protein N7450_001335 [Penicillium hetheringtonii]